MLEALNKLSNITSEFKKSEYKIALAKKFDEETGDIIPNLAKPRDIPETRWIDLRLQELPQTDVNPTDRTVNTNAE